MKKLLALFSFITLFSCSNEEETEKQMRKIIQEKLLTMFNQNTKKLEFQKEADEQYLVIVELENGERMQLIFAGTPEKYTIAETENSKAANMIGSSLGLVCESLTLKAIDSVTFNGTANLETGEKIQFFYDKNLGFYATDQASLGIVTRHQIANSIGMPCRNISLEKTEQELLFRGSAQIESGSTIFFFVHQQQGWYPVNEKNNLMLLTKLQLEAQNYKVDTLYTQAIDSALYAGRIRFSKPEAKEYLLNIRHTGTSFSWGLGEIKPNQAQ